MRRPSHFRSTDMPNLMCNSREIGGAWVPARPESNTLTWWGRFRLAFRVFVGRSDAITWPGQ